MASAARRTRGAGETTEESGAKVAEGLAYRAVGHWEELIPGKKKLFLNEIVICFLKRNVYKSTSKNCTKTYLELLQTKIGLGAATRFGETAAVAEKVR